MKQRTKDQRAIIIRYIGSMLAILLCTFVSMPKVQVNAFRTTDLSLDRFTMLQEIRAFKIMQREADQIITDVSIKSDNAMPSRAVQGDLITVTFSSNKEIDSITATIDGQAAKVDKVMDSTYEAAIIVDEINPTIGNADFIISFKTVDKQEQYQVHSVTDGSSVFLSDVTNIIDVPNDDIDFTGAIGQTSKNMLWEIEALFDHDASTMSHLSTDEEGENACVIFDFKNKGVNLGRVEILSSQDEDYESIEGITVFGSNDGESWMQIADNEAAATKSWQVLAVSGNQSYRYVKLANIKSKAADMAELRLFDKKERKQQDIMPGATSVKIFSDNYDAMRAYQDSVVSVSFELDKECKMPTAALEVVINGQKAYMAAMGSNSYYADVRIEDKEPVIGYVEFRILYRSISGKQKIITTKTTNNSQVFLSDERYLIDLIKEDVDIIDNTGKVNTDVMMQEVGKLVDNNVHSYSEFDSQNGTKEDYVVFDFKEEKVQLSRVELLARQDDYYSRIEGTRVLGSNDQKNWTILTDKGAKNTKLWQVQYVNNNTEYRYIKITNASAWYGNMAELRLFDSKERKHSEKKPVITEVTISSSNIDKSVAYPGDTVTMTFRTEEEVDYYEMVLEVLASGRKPQIKRIGERTYEAEWIIYDASYVGEIACSVLYCNLTGKQEAIATDTTDGSTVFITSDEKLIDVFNEDIAFTLSSSGSDSETMDNVKKMFDKDNATFSEYTLNRGGKGAYLVLDFKESKVQLERLEVLARQDDFYTRVEGLTVYGSNDGVDWEDITFYSADCKKQWQIVYTFGDRRYRYIKISNENDWYGNIAELRLIRYDERVDLENEGERNIGLGLGGIQNPTSTMSYAEKWTGSKVYFGHKGSTGILWRVLDKDNDGGVFLFADELVESLQKYHHAFKNTTWGRCSLRSYLNGYVYEGSSETYDEGVLFDYRENGFLTKYFAEAESEVIKETLTSTQNASNGFEGGPDVTNKLFLLSIQELENVKYGFSNKQTRANAEGEVTEYWWWTRSPATRSKAYATVVDIAGSIDKVGKNVGYGYNDGKGVRPAFNLDISSILFTSSASVSKVSYTNFGSEESLVTTNREDEEVWKVTLRGTEESLEVSTTDRTELPQGNVTPINIQHKKGSILENAAQVSAMLVDSNDNILYYGKITDDLEATSSTVTIPKELGLGSYTLKIFAETINGNQATDYATKFSDLPIEIVEAVPVNEILDLPDVIEGEDVINLGGSIQPSNASFQKIEYVIKDAAGLDISIKENVLYVGENSVGGVVIITAIVQNGLLDGKNYTKEFAVQIEANAPIPVTQITGVPDHATVGMPLSLHPVVEPTTATNQEIIWSIVDAKTTMAKVDKDVFIAENAGSAILQATIKDGAGKGNDYVQEFIIMVEDVVKPTEAPTVKPTETPRPTETPTTGPTETSEPTEAPTKGPTETLGPTELPEPTEAPTTGPTETSEPTEAPTVSPTETPRPTEVPTVSPTETPNPTEIPTMKPMETSSPSEEPIEETTELPSPTEVPITKPMETLKPSVSQVPTESTKPSVIPTPSESVEAEETPKSTPKNEETVGNKENSLCRIWWLMLLLVLVTIGIVRKNLKNKNE